MRRFAVGLVILILLGRGVWMAFVARSVASPPPMQTVSVGEQLWPRYAPLQGALQGQARVGYLGAAGSEPYHYARLAAAPALLLPDADQSLIVADLFDDRAINELVTSGEWRLVQRWPQGLAVLEKVSP